MFNLVFKNDDFVVIDKHPGVSVHKDDTETSLVAEVAKTTGDKQLYLIHRLDKMTSGLLLLGRHKEAASTLSGLFADRDVHKFYLLVSAQKPNKKQGAIIGDMCKSRRSMWKLMKTRVNPAITQFFSTSAGEGTRLFICKPLSGKTHQIRVAMKSIGATVLGDDIYGGEKSDRGYLHAFSLRFTYKEKEFDFILPPSIGEKWTQIDEKWMSPSLLDWPTLHHKKHANKTSSCDFL